MRFRFDTFDIPGVDPFSSGPSPFVLTKEVGACVGFIVIRNDSDEHMLNVTYRVTLTPD